MKTQAKIALLLGIFNSIIVLLFGIGVYYFLNEYSYIDFYKRLETRANIAAKYNLEPDLFNAENLKLLRHQYLEKLDAEKEYLIEVSSPPVPEEIALTNKLPKVLISNVLSDGKANEKSGNTFYTGIKHKHDNKLFIVVVSAENYYASHHLRFLRNILIWGIVFVFLIIGIVSIYFSKYIFNPIKKITARVKQISTENIHLRLEKNTRKDEIGELIHTFNDLLNRIETAFETQKNFISNASHELGTPLTSIIGEADVALIKNRDPDEYKSSLQNILNQAERLDQITKSLLFLAQTGYKGKTIPFEMIRVDEVLWETKELIDKLNPNNKVYIDFSLLPENPKMLKTRGNKQLLNLAIINVLNNACKYSTNKPVAVFIASSDTHVIVTIKDEGIGIPESEMRFIYDPFFRASNTKLFEGYGIGLPLTRNVVALHQGILTVQSVVNVGTSVQMRFPLYQFS